MERIVNRRGFFGLGGGAALLALGGETFAAAQENQAVGASGGIIGGAFKNGEYLLPELPYAAKGLEPFYDEATVTIHHSKHHAGYVKGLNSTLKELEKARQENNYAAIKALSRDLAFNGSGHILHCLFWHSMKAGGSEVPAEMAGVMEKSFGSVKSAMAQFSAAAKAVEGSGWAMLCYEPLSRGLLILQSEKHQNLTIWGAVPLLVCDIWEHAYYLQYKNDRGAWVDNFMKIADWQFAYERMTIAEKSGANLWG